MSTQCLRHYEPNDATALRDAVLTSHVPLGRWLPWAHARYGMDDALAFIATAMAGWSSGEGPFEWAIIVDGAIGGGIRLRYIDPSCQVGNLGYWVRTDLYGRGVAPAAAQQAARIGFDELGMRQLEIVAAAANRASRRVAEKLGARLQGAADTAASEPGHTATDVVYVLTPADLEGVAKATTAARG